METSIEFLKLEKIELGGIRGKILSRQVMQINEEFKEQYKVFQEKTTDTLDSNNQVCDVDNYRKNIYYIKS